MSSPFSTTSCTGALRTVFGRMPITVRASGSSSSASFMPARRLRLAQEGQQLADLAQLRGAGARRLPPSVTPSGDAPTVPNRLARQGIGEVSPSARIGRSNSTAGPPLASSRVQISVISSTVETGSATRTSSPSASSRAMKSRRDR